VSLIWSYLSAAAAVPIWIVAASIAAVAYNTLINGRPRRRATRRARSRHGYLVPMRTQLDGRPHDVLVHPGYRDIPPTADPAVSGRSR
jgi:hypothetical protein